MVPSARRHPRPARTSPWPPASSGAARPPTAGHGPRLRLAVALAAALSASSTSAACWVLGATPMVFTGYSPLEPAGVTATSTVAYSCDNAGTRPWLGISTPWTMADGGSSLAFELYQDAARTAPWPTATRISVASGVGIHTVTIHGFLPPGQDVPAGSYQTTLAVTMYTGGQGQNPGNAMPLVVSTSLARTCVIAAATLAFGSYDPLDPAPRDAQATIQVTCTRDTAYTVGLGPGDHAAATRQMANGAARLSYELYTDPARTTVWTTAAPVGGTAPSAAPIPLVVHGRIPAGQAVAAGAYSDLVQSTIDF